MSAVLLEKSDNKEHNRKVLQDVMAAILVKQNNETVAMLVQRKLPWNLNSIFMQIIPFISIERIWPLVT